MRCGRSDERLGGTWQRASGCGVRSVRWGHGPVACALHHDTVTGFITDPLAIALIPFTIIGIVAFAASLQRGAVAIALACQQAAITVIPSVIGLIVLGDKARHGFAVVTYAGFGITVVIVLALTFDTSAVVPPLVAPGILPPTPLNEVSGIHDT